MQPFAAVEGNELAEAIGALQHVLALRNVAKVPLRRGEEGNDLVRAHGDVRFDQHSVDELELGKGSELRRAAPMRGNVVARAAAAASASSRTAAAARLRHVVDAAANEERYELRGGLPRGLRGPLKSLELPPLQPKRAASVQREQRRAIRGVERGVKREDDAYVETARCGLELRHRCLEATFPKEIERVLGADLGEVLPHRGRRVALLRAQRAQLQRLLELRILPRDECTDLRHDRERGKLEEGGGRRDDDERGGSGGGGRRRGRGCDGLRVCGDEFAPRDRDALRQRRRDRVVDVYRGREEGDDVGVGVDEVERRGGPENALPRGARGSTIEPNKDSAHVVREQHLAPTAAVPPRSALEHRRGGAAPRGGPSSRLENLLRDEAGRDVDEVVLPRESDADLVIRPQQHARLLREGHLLDEVEASAVPSARRGPSKEQQLLLHPDADAARRDVDAVRRRSLRPIHARHLHEAADGVPQQAAVREAEDDAPLAHDRELAHAVATISGEAHARGFGEAAWAREGGGRRRRVCAVLVRGLRRG